jgi:hypothetical protein
VTKLSAIPSILVGVGFEVQPVSIPMQGYSFSPKLLMALCVKASRIKLACAARHGLRCATQVEMAGKSLVWS